MKKISLVISAYNSELYLKYCLESILNQTNTDARIIFVNDGSTDRTAEIIEEYIPLFLSKNFEFVFVNKTVNEGQAQAYNYALPLVCSDLFMWMDSDDTLPLNCFSDCISFMEKNQDIDLCIGRLIKKYDDHEELEFRTESDEDYFVDVLKCNHVLWGGTICVRVPYLFKRIPTKKIHSSKQGQNIQLLLPLLYKASYKYLPSAIYIYTIHNDSHSRKKRSFEEQYERYMDFLNLYCAVLDEIKILPFKEKLDYENYLYKEWCNISFNYAISKKKKKYAKRSYRELTQHVKLSLREKIKFFSRLNFFLSRLLKVYFYFKNKKK